MSHGLRCFKADSNDVKNLAWVFLASSRYCLDACVGEVYLLAIDFNCQKFPGMKRLVGIFFPLVYEGSFLGYRSDVGIPGDLF